ncbi:MAG: uracil-DNA glycosylase [Planctomycetaceae bacterium]
MADSDPRDAGPPSSRALAQRLESLADAGVEALPRPGRRAATLSTPAERATASATEAVAGAVEPPPPAAPRGGDGEDSRAATLSVLRGEVAGCRRCDGLAATRTQTVFGSGSPQARFCFLGEAPGADEDASGKPFVGRAGQLLTKIIESIRLTRDEVYILNVLKCRPPGNRVPEPSEVDNCRSFFERQLEAIRPEFIICLGTTAARSLLRSEEPIGRLRGRWFKHGSSQVVCTYHPSYLLRNPSAKRQVWEDMQALAARAGIVLDRG